MTKKKSAETGNEFLDQYNSEQWKQRRKEIIQIDGGRCKRCKSYDNLQVHHIHYVPHRMIWEYSDDELVTLCKSCHQEIHHYKSTMNGVLFKLMMSWCMGLADLSADYHDAMRIMEPLSDLESDDSKKYANICINTAMVFRDVQEDV